MIWFAEVNFCIQFFFDFFPLSESDIIVGGDGKHQLVFEYFFKRAEYNLMRSVWNSFYINRLVLSLRDNKERVGEK